MHFNICVISRPGVFSPFPTTKISVSFVVNTARTYVRILIQPNYYYLRFMFADFVPRLFGYGFSRFVLLQVVMELFNDVNIM